MQKAKHNWLLIKGYNSIKDYIPIKEKAQEYHKFKGNIQENFNTLIFY